MTTDNQITSHEVVTSENMSPLDYVFPTWAGAGLLASISILGFSNKTEVNSTSKYNPRPNTLETSEVPSDEMEKNTIHKMTGKLTAPLDTLHSKIDLYSTTIPDAPRPYRGGTHKGIDISGKKEPVYAITDGIIMERSPRDWVEIEQIEYKVFLQDIRSIAYSQGEDSLEYQQQLKQLYGKYVTIDHQNGLYSKYAHLDSIEDNMTIGTSISGGQLIGYTGNSGTSHSVHGRDDQQDLHLEIYNDKNQYFGQGLTANEVETALHILFSPNQNPVNKLNNLQQIIEAQNIEFLIDRNNIAHSILQSKSNEYINNMNEN